MEQLSPLQTNAVQAGIGMTIAGLGLLILSIINLNAARKLGSNISESPEPIALDQLLARGLEGNPNVWVRDMKVGEKCAGIHRTELGSTTYQYYLGK